MSAQLKVIVTRPGKIFGAMRTPGDDLTDIFNPDVVDNFQLLNNGVLKLVKVENEPTPAVKKVSKERTDK
jgi:hypothetical protein